MSPVKAASGRWPDDVGGGVTAKVRGSWLRWCHLIRELCPLNPQGDQGP